MKRFLLFLLSVIVVMAVGETEMEEKTVVSKKLVSSAKKLIKKITKKKVTKKTVKKKVTKLVISAKKKIVIHKKKVKTLRKTLNKLKLDRKSRKRASNVINAEYDRVKRKINFEKKKIAGYKVFIKTLKKKTAKIFIEKWGTFELDITKKGEKIKKKCMTKNFMRTVKKLIHKKDTKKLCTFIKETTIPENCDKLEIDMERRLKKIVKWRSTIYKTIHTISTKFYSLRKYVTYLYNVAVTTITYLKASRGRGYEYCLKVKKYLRAIVKKLYKKEVILRKQWGYVHNYAYKSMYSQMKYVKKVIKDLSDYLEIYIRAHPPKKRTFKVYTDFDHHYEQYTKILDVLIKYKTYNNKILYKLSRIYQKGSKQPSYLKKATVAQRMAYLDSEQRKLTSKSNSIINKMNRLKLAKYAVHSKDYKKLKTIIKKYKKTVKIVKTTTKKVKKIISSLKKVKKGKKVVKKSVKKAKSIKKSKK